MKVEGVTYATVALATEEAEVRFDPRALAPPAAARALPAAVEAAGYEAQVLATETLAPAPGESNGGGGGSSSNSRVQLLLEGADSHAAIRTVEGTLSALLGVARADVHPSGESVWVTFDPEVTGARTMIEALESATPGGGSGGLDSGGSVNESLSGGVPGGSAGGGEVAVTPRGMIRARLAESVRGEGERERRAEVRAMWRTFVWSAVFTTPVFLLAMVLNRVPPFKGWLETRVVNRMMVGDVLRWALATPVQFVAGRRFHAGAARALRRRSANMDVLVSLGTNAAYGYSVFSVVSAAANPRYVGTDFFETSAMLISFILLGKGDWGPAGVTRLRRLFCVEKVEGVTYATVALATEEAEVRFDPRALAPPAAAR
eukprot:jgi/Mesen1/2828/ME001732S01988